MSVAAVGAAAVGGLIAADAASSAAETQANAIGEASAISAEAAAQARRDVIGLTEPALRDFAAGIQAASGQLLSGI